MEADGDVTTEAEGNVSVDGDRDTATSQGMPAASRSWRRKTGFCPGASREASSAMP